MLYGGKTEGFGQILRFTEAKRRDLGRSSVYGGFSRFTEDLRTLSVASEADFNNIASAYEYNDPWIKSITRDFVKLNDAVVTYLDTKPPSVPSDPGAEEKFNLASRAQVEKIISKIRLESSQVTESLDETYKRLGSLTQINTGQSQVYNNLKNELLAVLDDKIPCLIQSLIDVAGASDQIEVKKIEKPRLYQLLQVIAEKTQDSQPSSYGRPAGAKSESVHLKKMDPPRFSGNEVDYP